MKKSNIYTGTGDKGFTTLVGGSKVSKTDPRLEAYGTVDELNAHIGWLMQVEGTDSENEILSFIQNKLFVIGSYLATDTALTELREASRMKSEDVLRIERRIDELDMQLPPISNFVLPGGTPAAAASHICRTVCRRAERRICEVSSQAEVDDNLMKFMNRLSDYLFVFARFNSFKEIGTEIFWNKSC